MVDKLFEDFDSPDNTAETFDQTGQTGDDAVAGPSNAPGSASQSRRGFHTRAQSSVNTLASVEDGSLTPILGSGFPEQSSAFAPQHHNRMHSLDNPLSTFIAHNRQGSMNMQESGTWQQRIAEHDSQVSSEIRQASQNITASTEGIRKSKFRGARDVEEQSRLNAQRRELFRKQQEQRQASNAPNQGVSGGQSNYSFPYGQNVRPSNTEVPQELNSMSNTPMGFSSLFTGSADPPAQANTFNSRQSQVQNPQRNSLFNMGIDQTRMSQIGQTEIGQMNQSQLDQLNQMNQLNRMNIMNQLNQLNQSNQIGPMGQANRMNQMAGQMGNQRRNQMSQMGQMGYQSNQMGQSNQTKQLGHMRNQSDIQMTDIPMEHQMRQMDQSDRWMNQGSMSAAQQNRQNLQQPFGQFGPSDSSSTTNTQGQTQQDQPQTLEELLEASFPSPTVKQESERGESNIFNTWPNMHNQSFGNAAGEDINNNNSIFDSQGNLKDPFQGVTDSQLHFSPQEDTSQMFASSPGAPTTPPTITNVQRPSTQRTSREELLQRARQIRRSHQRSQSDMGGGSMHASLLPKLAPSPLRPLNASQLRTTIRESEPTHPNPLANPLATNPLATNAANTEPGFLDLIAENLASEGVDLAGPNLAGSDLAENRQPSPSSSDSEPPVSPSRRGLPSVRTNLGEAAETRPRGRGSRGRGSRGGRGARGAARGRGRGRRGHGRSRSASHADSPGANLDPVTQITDRAGYSSDDQDESTTRTPGRRPPRKRQNYRRRQSSRNLDSIDGDGTDPKKMLRMPLEIPGLTYPNLTTGPPELKEPPRGIYWSLTRNFTQPIPPVDNRRATEVVNMGNPVMKVNFEIPYEPNGDYSTVPIRLCQPPLFDLLPPYPTMLDPDNLPRARKQSKYTPHQDRVILELKANGHNWAHIAREAECTNQLAARNRYQVLIGQQGGAAFFWTADDCAVLQSLLDEAERAKWLFVAEELTRKLGREITLEMAHFRIAHLFCEDSLRFGVVQRESHLQGAAPLQRITLDRDARDELIRLVREAAGRRR